MGGSGEPQVAPGEPSPGQWWSLVEGAAARAGDVIVLADDRGRTLTRAQFAGAAREVAAAQGVCEGGFVVDAAARGGDEDMSQRGEKRSTVLWGIGSCAFSQSFHSRYRQSNLPQRVRLQSQVYARAD